MKVRFAAPLIKPYDRSVKSVWVCSFYFQFTNQSSNELKSINKSKQSPQTVKPHRIVPTFVPCYSRNCLKGLGYNRMSPDEKPVFHNDMLFLPCSGDWLHIRICSNEIREARKTKKQGLLQVHCIFCQKMQIMDYGFVSCFSACRFWNHKHKSHTGEDFSSNYPQINQISKTYFRTMSTSTSHS